MQTSCLKFFILYFVYRFYLLIIFVYFFVEFSGSFFVSNFSLGFLSIIFFFGLEFFISAQNSYIFVLIFIFNCPQFLDFHLVWNYFLSQIFIFCLNFVQHIHVWNFYFSLFIFFMSTTFVSCLKFPFHVQKILLFVILNLFRHKNIYIILADQIYVNE